MGDRHLRLVQPNQQQGRQNEMFNEMLRGFVVWADAWPWEWTAQDVDEWSADLRDRGLALSTLRNRQGVIRRFCEYAVNPQYPGSNVAGKSSARSLSRSAMNGIPLGISRSTIIVPSGARSPATSFVPCSITSMTGSSRWWARTTRALRSPGETPPCSRCSTARGSGRLSSSRCRHAICCLTRWRLSSGAMRWCESGGASAAKAERSARAAFRWCLSRSLRRCAFTLRTSARCFRTDRGYGHRSGAVALVGSSRSACAT